MAEVIYFIDNEQTTKQASETYANGFTTVIATTNPEVIEMMRKNEVKFTEITEERFKEIKSENEESSRMAKDIEYEKKNAELKKKYNHE